jgi:hypothetical protein
VGADGEAPGAKGRHLAVTRWPGGAQLTGGGKGCIVGWIGSDSRWVHGGDGARAVGGRAATCQDAIHRQWRPGRPLHAWLNEKRIRGDRTSANGRTPRSPAPALAPAPPVNGGRDRRRPPIGADRTGSDQGACSVADGVRLGTTQHCSS